MKNLNILMISRVLPHHAIGGMQSVAWDLAREFIKKNCSVTIISAPVTGREAEFIDECVKIITIKGVHWSRYGVAWSNALGVICTKPFLSQYDVILGISSAAAALLDISRSMDIPIVMQAHGTSLGEAISKWKSGSIKSYATSIKNVVGVLKGVRTYPRYSSIIPIGKAVDNDFHKFPLNLCVNKKKVRLISNGVDENSFHPCPAAKALVCTQLGISPQENIIVSLSRLHKQKGLDYSLKAFALALRKDKALQYVIVGDGPENIPLRDLAEKLNISGNVHFIGAVDRVDAVKYLQSASLMLFTTTRIEGLPMNILESLAVGVPVIVSKHVADQEFISDFVFPVNPRDANLVCDAIFEALKYKVGQSLLPKKYSLSSVADQYISHFSDLRSMDA